MKYPHTDADIQIPKHINISSNDSTLLVPIHVKDDGIAEARECGDLSLVLPRVRKYGSLYEIAYTNSRLRMCINDNDSKFIRRSKNKSIIIKNDFSIFSS